MAIETNYIRHSSLVTRSTQWHVIAGYEYDRC